MSEVDSDRIERRLNTLEDITSTPKEGVTRLGYSEAETAAIEYLIDELPSEFEWNFDAYGNLMASPWPESSNSIFVGSHLDSVKNGGPLDGTLGVVTALEAIQTIVENDLEPSTTPTLVVFRCEESPRFGEPMIGSKLALGKLTDEDLQQEDGDGTTIRKAICSSEHTTSTVPSPPPATIDYTGDEIAGFLEVHIEQGRVLENEGDDLGLVTEIRAPVRFKLFVDGMWDHSGATPMDIRRDALAGACRMVSAADKIGRHEHNKDETNDIVVTVGELTAGGQTDISLQQNKICGAVTFSLELRSVDESYRDNVEQDILRKMQSVARDVNKLEGDQADLDVKIGLYPEDRKELSEHLDQLEDTAPRELAEENDPAHNRGTPTPLSDSMRERLSRAAESAGASYQCLPSGGGHDAMQLQLVEVPTGLVFVPSIDGISHHPDEATVPKSKEAAAETIFHTLLDESPT